MKKTVSLGKSYELSIVQVGKNGDFFAELIYIPMKYVHKHPVWIKYLNASVSMEEAEKEALLFVYKHFKEATNEIRNIVNNNDKR